jgi:hypothetical protein
MVWPPSHNLGLPGEVNDSLVWLVIFTGKPAIRNCQRLSIGINKEGMGRRSHHDHTGL